MLAGIFRRSCGAHALCNAGKFTLLSVGSPALLAVVDVARWIIETAANNLQGALKASKHPKIISIHWGRFCGYECQQHLMHDS
jgi:hypothetical protein